MKKLILISLFVVVTQTTKAQVGVPDTLTYLQSIVANKAQFIGQPFSRLMDSIKLKIRYFHPIRSITYKISKETSTLFAFYFPNTIDEQYLIYPCLEVYWQPHLNAGQSDTLWKNNNGGGWAPTVSTFYRPGIVTDIRLFQSF